MAEVKTIRDVLVGHAQVHDCQFLLTGIQVGAKELFSDELMLPVVTVHAQSCALSLMGHGLGCIVRKDESALLKVRSDIPEFSFGRTSDLMRALFFIHSAEKIFGISRGGAIDCTPVFEFFNKPLEERVDLTRQGVEVVWPMAQPVVLV